MKKTSLILISAILLSGCNIEEIFKKKKEEEKKIDQTFNIKVPVTVTPATQTTLVKHVKTNGYAEAVEFLDICSEISGNVKILNKCENCFVQEGDEILVLDKEKLALDLEKAEIDLKKAEAEFSAWKKLGEGTSEEQLKLRTGLSDAEIIVKRIKLDIEKSIIKAPISGYLTDLSVIENEHVNIGEKLFSIYNTDKILVKANILESEISRIEIGNIAKIMFPGIKDKIYQGIIKSVSPKIDPVSRTCSLEILLENDSKIKHGMYAEVKVDAEKYEDQLIVHKDAILVRDGKKLIFAVDGEKAKWQYVTLGEENEYFVAITKGVKADQQVIIDGNFSLSHDADIKVKKEIEFNELVEIF